MFRLLLTYNPTIIQLKYTYFKDKGEGMQMLKIMKEKEVAVSKILSDAQEKLQKILVDEFKDFDVVKVESHAFYDMLELHKSGRIIKIHLASKRYDSGKVNKRTEGLYFKKSPKSGEEFSETEFKEIQMRLQAVYEK